MDSLGIFEWCAGLEERYGVSVESFLHSQITVGELETIVRKALLPGSSSQLRQLDISLFSITTFP